MDHTRFIAEFFLVAVAFAYTLFSPLASSELTGHGFIKLISRLSLGSLTLATLMSIFNRDLLPLPLGLKLISIIFLGVISYLHQDRKSIFMWILWLMTNFLLGWNLILLAHGPFLNILFLIGSSIFLGIITYAMTLGHWYLVVPRLSEKPLKIAAILTWIILFLKVMLSLYSLSINTQFFASDTTLGAGFAFNFILLLMRFLFGYVVILGMSIFNWRLVAMRSIQSSTGILYAMTFFVFVGELISTYLFFNYGLFI